MKAKGAILERNDLYRLFFLIFRTFHTPLQFRSEVVFDILCIIPQVKQVSFWKNSMM